MESENVGVCSHSSYSRLDDLVHHRLFDELSLRLLDSKTLLNPLLEPFNYPVTKTCRVNTSKADTVILDTLSGYRCTSNE